MTKKPESKSYIKLSKKGMISMSSKAKKDILKIYENDEKPVYFELINTKENTGVGTLYFVDHNYDGQRFDATKEICDKSADKIINEVFDDFDNEPGSAMAIRDRNQLEASSADVIDHCEANNIKKWLITEISLYDSFFVGKAKFVKIGSGKNNVRAVLIDPEYGGGGMTLTNYLKTNYPGMVFVDTTNKRGIYSAVYGTAIPTSGPIFVRREDSEGKSE